MAGGAIARDDLLGAFRSAAELAQGAALDIGILADGAYDAIAVQMLFFKLTYVGECNRGAGPTSRFMSMFIFTCTLLRTRLSHTIHPHTCNM